MIKLTLPLLIVFIYETNVMDLFYNNLQNFTAYTLTKTTSQIVHCENGTEFSKEIIRHIPTNCHL